MPKVDSRMLIRILLVIALRGFREMKYLLEWIFSSTSTLVKGEAPDFVCELVKTFDRLSLLMHPRFDLVFHLVDLGT